MRWEVELGAWDLMLQESLVRSPRPHYNPSMEKDPANHPEPAAAGQPKVRQPWTVPHLRVFGSVATITSSVSMAGSVMDGGPNNLKT